MRLFLLGVVIITGVNIGHSIIDKQHQLQYEKFQQWCKIDPELCQSTSN